MENSVDTLNQKIEWFESAEEASATSRREAERDRDYFDAKQHTSDEKKKLNARGQPVVTINRIRPKVEYLTGIEKQTRKDPKAFPRTPMDEETASAATDGIRYACDASQWDAHRSAAWENMLVEGIGIVEVGAKRTRDGVDPYIKSVPWDRFFYDPYSADPYFTDAMYLGYVVWMDRETAERMFPDGKDAIEQTMLSVRPSDTYDDKPKYKLWADGKRNRVRIVQMWHRESGQWQHSIFTKGGWLQEPQTSPYLDENGEPECAIKAASAYVDRDNNRYGVVRDMISPQDEINKRRSKALHLLSVRQSRMSRAMAGDKVRVRSELARPDGIVVADRDDFDILPTGDMAAAQFQLLQEAKNEIDRLGPNAALQGKNEATMSGRAILAQQQGGMVEVASLMDRLRNLSLEVYKSVWNRIRQFWTAERWVRITDDQRNTRFVGFNKPVTYAEAAAKQLQGDPEAEQKLMMLAADPRAQMVIGTENNPAEINVDIVIDEGIDTPTIQAEQFDMLTKMVGAGMPIPPDVLIEASSLRNKEKLLQMLRQPPAPEQQAAQQIALEGEAAKVNKTKSETMKNLADAQKAITPDAQLYLPQTAAG